VSRRSFTIIETVLAATLSSLVVLGCMGGFMALSRSDRTLTARFHEANDLARIQRTMQRAFSTLLMAPESPLDDIEEEDGQDTGELPAAEDTDEMLTGAVVAVPVPRIILEQDNDPALLSLLQSSRFAAGGGGSSIAAPQRLELVLSAVPIRPPAVQSTVWTQALVGVDDLANPTTEAEQQYAGVRGAFVLRPDDAEGMDALAREVRSDDRIGWTLWWQPVDTRSEPARIASGLAACAFQVFRNREMVGELLAYTPEEMPTYIQLEVETLTGLYANYLFEVVWTVDQLEEEDTTTSGGGGGGGGQGGGQDGAQGGDAQGGGNGRDGAGGGRGTNGRDPRARPRPNSPQGAGPGQRIDGRARPQGRPGERSRLATPPGDRPGRPQGPGGGGGGG